MFIFGPKSSSSQLSIANGRILRHSSINNNNYFNKFFTVLIVILINCIVGNLCAWQENTRPKLFVQLAADEVQKFQGNESAIDHFRLLIRVGDSLLVGGRNVIYNLSIADLSEQHKIIWRSSEDDMNMCIVKGKDEEACQNYIRVLTEISPQGTLLACGTNAFRPVCHYYNISTTEYTLDKAKPGQAICPYGPHHNSTALFVDNDLYVGTEADFSGNDPIIYREPLQTDQYDSLSLNAPNFVGSFSFKDFVYFFFRETAIEYMNCGKAIFSRVARVCKWDKGGPHRFRNRWTTFLKSRLNCSVPGDFPFYFNEIQSTSDLITGNYGKTDTYTRLIYGVFTTPDNAIAGSAICAFSLQDIAETFEGNFKEKASSESNWLPVRNDKVPDPRPGSCHNESKLLPEPTLNFLKSHTMMDENVPPYFGFPIVTRVGVPYRFTQIAVDPQIKTPGEKAYDVIFVGTDQGKVLKIINAASADDTSKVSSVVIEELDVLAKPEPIRNLKIIRTTQYEAPSKDGSYDDGKLVIVTDSQILSIPLHRCHSEKINSCSDCVAMQDPYCAWDKISGKCRSHGAPRWSDETFFYSQVATGQHQACPSNKQNSGKETNIESQKGYDEFDIRNGKASGTSSKSYDEGGPQITADVMTAQYTVETVVMAVLAAAIFAMLVGFITGYFCGRRCHKDEDDNLPYPDTEYEYFEQRSNINRLQTEPKLLPQVEEVTYAEPVLLPQPPNPNKIHQPPMGSPKSTLRKPMGFDKMIGHHHQGVNSEALFQFQPDGYNPPREGFRGRDNFGTLRSHQGDNYRRGEGFSTTRSVKKVYL